MPLDMVQIGQDLDALLAELRLAGAVIKSHRGNVPCPYHGGSDSGSIHQGEDGRWRFKCFSCNLGPADVLDLQAIREGKELKDVLRETQARQQGNGQSHGHQRVNHYSSVMRRPTPDTTADSADDPQDSTAAAPPAASPQPEERGSVRGQRSHRFADLDTLKKAAEFRDYDILKKDHPEFTGKRVLAKTFTYTNPDTKNADLIIFRMEGTWEDAEGKPGRKSILQGCQINGTSYYEMRRPNGLAPLFNRSALRTAEVVVVVEGEGKVVTLRKLGFIATCSPGGSQAAARADWTPLNGKKLVIIWRDKDAISKKTGKRPGLDYQNEVITQLNKLPKPPLIKVVDVDSIKELPENGSDVVDLVKAMGMLPDPQKASIIQGLLDAALPTGAHALLKVETAEVIAGQRDVVDWPWSILSDFTEAVAAGTMCVLCGDPGASKSLFLLQAFMHWHKSGIPISLLELEDISWDKDTGMTSPVFHLRRAAAMLSGNNMLTSLRWVKDHPVETDKALADPFLSSFGQCLHALPRNVNPTVDVLLAWTQQQIDRGVRIVAIDPVTLADLGRDTHTEDAKLVRGIKRMFEGSKASLIAVTHPRPGARRRTLDDMALTRDWGRHTQTAIWYESHDIRKQDLRVYSAAMGQVRVTEEFNRTMHIQKARNTGFQFAKLGYFFSKQTLMVKEVGEIVQEKKK